MILADYCNLNH